MGEAAIVADGDSTSLELIATVLAREGFDVRATPDGGDALARTLDQLASELAGWLEQADGPWLEALRSALRHEVERWQERAAADPAARRVRDLFAAALDLLAADQAQEQRPAGPRRPPQRKAAR